MNPAADEKVKRIIKELNDAFQDYSTRFIDPVILHTDVKTHDFFEMALAQDKVNLLETQFKLALTEAYPDKFSENEKEFLKKEVDRFTKRLRAWQNRQMPSREE